MKTRIYRGMDSAMLIDTGKTRLLIDAIHGGTTVGMSLMTEELIDDMKHHKGMFQDVDGLLVTHLHVDHYNPGKIGQFLRVFKERSQPMPRIYGPNMDLTNVDFEQVNERTKCFHINELTIYAIHTIHDGEAFRQDYHESYLILTEEVVIFIGGDAELFPEDADEILNYTDHVDLDFRNIYQIVSASSQEMLRKLTPKHLIMNHMPSKKDDELNYWMMWKSAKKRFDVNGLQVVIPEDCAWLNL